MKLKSLVAATTLFSMALTPIMARAAETRASASLPTANSSMVMGNRAMAPVQSDAEFNKNRTLPLLLLLLIGGGALWLILDKDKKRTPG